MFELTAPISGRGDLDWCWYLRREGRVGEALERALHDIGVLQPGGWAAWAPSTLTDTGAPVEMQFSADQSGLSLITEVDDPTNDPASRLATAYAQIKRLKGTLPSAALRDVISAAQGAASLEFGARLGLRQCRSAMHTTLFAEMPDAAADLTRLLSKEFTLPSDVKEARMTMLAYDSSTGQVTLYFETTMDVADAVPHLAKLAQVGPSHLLSQTARLLAHGREDASLGKWSFSLTYGAQTQAPILQLRYRGGAIYHDDAQMTQLTRDYAGAHLASYDALIETQHPAPAGRTYHGWVGLRARPATYPVLSVSVAAPWGCPFETA